VSCALILISTFSLLLKWISSKFNSICFVAILSISLKSRTCKNDHILFNVGTSKYKVTQ
jgi:hypothetical protein